MKSLKKNYVYNLIYQIVAIIAPLITAPYIARVLGAENIGKYSYTQSIVSYIILLTTLGTTMYAQREISFHQGDMAEQTKSFVEIVSIRILMGLIGFIALLFLIIFYKQYRVLFLIQSLELLSNMLCVDWFYAGNEEFKITMVRNIVIRILNIICIFLLVRTMNDLYKYVLIIVLGGFLGNLSLWFRIGKFLSKSAISLRSLSLKKHILGSISVFAAQIAASVYSMLDKTMIGIITNSNVENGYYEQAQKIEKIALTFVAAMGTVILPRISKAHSRKDTRAVKNSITVSFNYMWMLALPMMFGIIGTASSFVPWFYGPGYEKSIVLIQILALLIVAIGINNITGVQYLMAIKKEKILTFTEIVGAVVNVIFNLILIQRMASVGAAIASVIAEVTVAVTQMFCVRKELDIKNLMFLSKNYFISSGIMFLFIELLKNMFLNECTIVNFFLLVVLGTIVYFGILILLNDTFLVSIIKKITKGKV